MILLLCKSQGTVATAHRKTTTNKIWEFHVNNDVIHQPQFSKSMICM